MESGIDPMNYGEGIRVAFASSSLLALPSVDFVASLSSVEVVGFISTPDRPKGRSGRPTSNEFARSIEERGHQVFKPNSDRELLEVLDSLKPNLVIVIAYGRMIKGEALSRPDLGWVNLHFSLLPAFRGAAPVQRTLIAGVEDFGFTIFKIDEGMDTGPYFVRESVEVGKDDCATEILDQLAKIAAASFESVILDLVSSRLPQRQIGDISIAPKIMKEELSLDLTGDGKELFQRIRGLTRKPGPWFFFRGKRIVINKARLVDDQVKPLNFSIDDGRLLLGLNGLTLSLDSLTPEGRREMTGIEFAHGLRLAENHLYRVDE